MRCQIWVLGERVNGSKKQTRAIKRLSDFVFRKNRKNKGIDKIAGLNQAPKPRCKYVFTSRIFDTIEAWPTLGAPTKSILSK